MKKALITGVSGQDGSYMADLLLEKGYEVYGTIQENSNLKNIEHIKDKIKLLKLDLAEQDSVNEVVKESQPDEIYHFASFHFIGDTWDDPVKTGDINALGTLRLFQAIKKIKPDAKCFNASSSEMYGMTDGTASEETPFNPKNPYGIAKEFAHRYAISYRTTSNMFVANGILFNHESPRRGEKFVTKKIVKAVVDIKNGKQDCLYLGNIYSKRDWGYAKDYVEGAWMMLQENTPNDYTLSTGEAHSVKDLMTKSFQHVGIEIESNGKEGVEEEFTRKDTGNVIVRISKDFFRPAESLALVGDSSKIQKAINWAPKVPFDELVKIMVDNEEKHLNDD